ncbi:MAG TPA: low temperature requirement protein A, partial [Steroidobacteraceae bacterium]
MNPHRSLLRSREGHARVTFVELFFDLVFVFAVTQLSHTLLEHLNLRGALQTAFLLLAVWWVWVYTCWFTNWIDPDRPAVRMLMFALMLAGLLMSAAIPNAFGHEGPLFAIAYAFIQVGRTVFMVAALRGRDAANHRNFLRILAWLMVSAVFWIAGGYHDGAERVISWVIALSLEIIGPTLGYRVPGLGRSSTTDWKIDGAHMAERFALFVIIALGESILVTGATAASAKATWPVVAAFVVAFLGSVAMWWIYFNVGAERGSRQIAGAADPGRIGRAV